MKKILPKGFLASGIHCGLKKRKPDLALLYSKMGCKAAGIFTKNKVKAAPVLVSKAVLKQNKPIHAIITNSANANCCTGWYGPRDAKRMMHAVGKSLKIGFNNILVMSTGIIGKRLPIEKIENSVPKLVKTLSEKGLLSASKAILTTGKKPRVYTEKIVVRGKEIIITGFAKGAGMINPNMATMLAFLLTDARVDKSALKGALKEAADGTFNSITVDGDMSTNDSVILLANGSAGNRPIKKETKEYSVFLKALTHICEKLSQDIIKDGEGATKFVTVTVKSAATKKDACKVARSIANSPLVKTSIHGENPNWGRVASSVGASGAKSIAPNKIEVYLDEVCVFKNGKFTMPQGLKYARIYKKKNVSVMVNLNAGKEEATVFTCDLSKKYVEINARYS
ncbi:MAG: bifunctional glutamate N-acetyltransferase/amino-acid acetyltransferase ArgJ [Candidatus Omnitrophica bacterium]|nr:bifunctional glutamate N-acetyltransferase/amino-acid acetyltransferase ArgJ [Candidatus Omnitrophota bacterium]